MPALRASRTPRAPRPRSIRAPQPRAVVPAAALLRAYTRQDVCGRLAMLDAALDVAHGSRTHPSLVPVAQALLRLVVG